jgi:FdrA protein
MMGTPANLALMREGGFFDDDPGVGPDDLVVSVRAESEGTARTALGRIEDLLDTPSPAGAALPSAATLEDAVLLQPRTNVAVISLPGEYAAAEARGALERGLHVFLFSSNVPLEEELALKLLARERGLLCMGPDCGTAILAGKGLGFANAVRRGPVGIVGASGTGIQEVASLLDGFGVGVSHAIGCGSRDLSAAVGGSTALAGLAALLRDPTTEAVVVLSKPPDPVVAGRLRAASDAAAKPVVLGFVGGDEELVTLDEVARRAARTVGHEPQNLPRTLPAAELAELRGSLRPSQRYVRGLYAGGTLAYEAQLVLREAGLTVASNAPLAGAPGLADPHASEGDTIVDLGAEEFTRGRPHPMIDARERRSRLLQEARDPQTAVVLLDVVLGYGAAADPAGDLADTVAAAASRVVVLAHVCGTAADPQRLGAQERTLREAGATLLPTNAALARTAAALLAPVEALR